MDFRSLLNTLDTLNEAEEWTPTPEQEKWLGGADRQDPYILNRMPGDKPPVSYFKDPADQATAKQMGFPEAPTASPAAPTAAQAAQPDTSLQDKIAKLNQLVKQFQTPAPQSAKPAAPQTPAQPAAGQAATPTQAAQLTAEPPVKPGARPGGVYANGEKVASGEPLVPASEPGSPSANIAAKQAAEQPGTFTFTKKDGTTLKLDKDGKPLQESTIAKSLVESFGYEFREEAVGLGGQLGAAGAAIAAKKLAGNIGGKVIPGAGTTLSAIDAYNRWQEGDRSGAVISTLAGVGWLVPGPLGWMLGGGLDAANLARDYKAGKFSSNDENTPVPTKKQAAQPADPKVVALQKYLVSQGAKNKDGTPLTVDGVMGNNTKAAMDAVGLQESLDEAWFNPAAIKSGIGALKNIGKNFASGIKGGGVVQPMVKQARGGAIAGKLAPGARTAQKVGSTIAKNPKKIAAAGVAAGTAAGLLGRNEPADTNAPSASSKKTGSQAAQPARTNPCAGKEELVKQIQSAIADLKSISGNDPKAAEAVASAEKALARCSSQAAQPADSSTPLERFYTGQRRVTDLE